MDAEVDVGLGTAYERVAVYRLLRRWASGRALGAAFEGPVDNMAGIPGLHLLGLARAGVKVTVALSEARWLDNVRAIYRAQGCEAMLETRLVGESDPLPSRAFDLAVTYNALPVVADWRALLGRVAEASRRWLVVAVTNPASYGVWIRQGLRVLEPGARPELFDHPTTHPRVVEPVLGELGTIVDHVYVDCPWWPDLFVDAGESLLGATLKRMPLVGARLGRLGTRTLAPRRFVYGARHFPLLDPDPELAAALARHPTFDGAPEPVARAFGHLHAYLVDLDRRPP